MNINKTNMYLREAKDELMEGTAVYALVDGRNIFLGLDSDTKTLMRRFPIWDEEMWGLYKLKGVPKKLLARIKSMKPIAAWEALKRYVSDVEAYGDGFSNEREVLKWQEVTK
ncbi:hypothetical protein E2P64_08155 [Candidatus Bathyarchaeota archaeon]|nr:hypothetical protein E2P64_08155 [Candidatus Bathyarchaeota archaeon]